MLRSDGFSEQIRGQDIYLRLLMSIGGLSTMTYTSTSNEWQRNVLNYEAAINSLEAQCAPFLPKDYHDRIRAIKRRAQTIRDHAKATTSPFEMMRVGRDLEVKLTCAVANERLKIIIESLHKANLLVPKNYNGIEDDPEDDDDEYIEAEPGAPFPDGTPISAPDETQENHDDPTDDSIPDPTEPTDGPTD